jgi:hypothetical protein
MSAPTTPHTTAEPPVGCPLCGDPMDPQLVACWPCYRASARLTPGTWPDPDRPGQTWTLTAGAVARCDTLRAQRLARRSGEGLA